MRHLSLVEWRTWSGVPRQQTVLCESRQFEFNVHGKVQRLCFSSHRLPKVDALGENLKARLFNMGFLQDLFLPEPYLRFTNKGIVFTKDFNTVPWSYVCGYECDDDNILTITFWGGFQIKCCNIATIVRTDDDFSNPDLDRDDMFDFSKAVSTWTSDDIKQVIETVKPSLAVAGLIAETDKAEIDGNPVIGTIWLYLGEHMAGVALALNSQSDSYNNYGKDFIKTNLPWVASKLQDILNGFEVTEEASNTEEGATFRLICTVMENLSDDNQCYLWHHNYSIYGKYGKGELIESREEKIDYLFASGRALLTSDGISRKIICCTEKPIQARKIENGNKYMMILMSSEIEIFNARVEESKKLIFQPGHPQDGCTYVQHPFRKNVYYEVNSYHDSLRERKQNELLRILESLGAYSARVEVRHEQQEQRDTESEINVSGSGSYGAVSGSSSTKQNVGRQSSTSSSQSAAVDWSFNPPEKPCIPDDLVFYPTEEKWQQLAASVLRGGLKRAVVDLEYKSEYGITEKYLSDISASAKSLIPSFEMNLNKSFSSNLRRLTSTQWHYEVVFENETGERAGAPANASSAKLTPQISSDTNKAEALFAKRARRYAQSEGHINAEQRADLEAFAQKYGIDDFRMEELIEEAFA